MCLFARAYVHVYVYVCKCADWKQRVCKNWNAVKLCPKKMSNRQCTNWKYSRGSSSSRNNNNNDNDNRNDGSRINSHDSINANSNVRIFGCIIKSKFKSVYRLMFHVQRTYTYYIDTHTHTFALDSIHYVSNSCSLAHYLSRPRFISFTCSPSPSPRDRVNEIATKMNV